MPFTIRFYWEKQGKRQSVEADSKLRHGGFPFNRSSCKRQSPPHRPVFKRTGIGVWKRNRAELKRASERSCVSARSGSLCAQQCQAQCQIDSGLPRGTAHGKTSWRRQIEGAQARREVWLWLGQMRTRRQGRCSEKRSSNGISACLSENEKESCLLSPWRSKASAREHGGVRVHCCRAWNGAKCGKDYQDTTGHG